jgi:hypothetical protein
VEICRWFYVKLAAFHHFKYLMGLHGAEGAVASHKLGQGACKQLTVPEYYGALVNSFLKAFASVYPQAALGFLPGLSEKQVSST